MCIITVSQFDHAPIGEGGFYKPLNPLLKWAVRNGGITSRQEFFLAAGNPKAILIFTAFLPQFVDPTGSVGFQFLILGALFLMLEWVAIAGYAFFGKALRHWFSRPSMRRLFNRICAGLLGSAGVGLLLAPRE